tara:strand:- start:630 stop:839 length:210 start_codon:yes stop_codon:yes gene_type:complete
MALQIAQDVGENGKVHRLTYHYIQRGYTPIIAQKRALREVAEHFKHKAQYAKCAEETQRYKISMWLFNK